MPATNLSRHARFYIAKRYFKGHSGAQLHLRKTENEFKIMVENFILQMPTLKGRSALEMWREGPEVWNRWARQHQGYNISFAGVDFTDERSVKGSLNFSGYYFGTGKVDFSYAVFGNRDVNFSKADFGDGDVNFSEAIFGKGNLNFSKAIFGNGEVKFSGVTFGDGDVDFSDSVFGEGNIIFSKSTFGKGNITFFKTNFSDGNLDFYGTKFNQGEVNFSMSSFGIGDVKFINVNFGNGDINFTRCDFGKGNLYFIHAIFGDGLTDFSEIKLASGNIDFYGANFNEGDVNFSYANFPDCNIDLSYTNFGCGKAKLKHTQLRDLAFRPIVIKSSDIEAEGLSIKGRATFELPESVANLQSFNLHSASFDGPLALRGDLSIIPDLRATRYSHQVDLSDLKVKLPRAWRRLGWPPKLSREAEDPKDGAKLRRLKEIAETNKDHQAALRFSADENRAKRWIETSWAGSVLDMAFSAFSDYGQNILRPFVALIVLTAASMGLYKTLATETFANGWTGWAHAALLSASNSLPFLPQSRDLREDALTALYRTTDPSLCIDILMITQGVLSFIFLFLIGLGLRNRFRL